MAAMAGLRRDDAWRRVLALFTLCFFACAAWAQNLQPIPPLTAHVIDQTGTLDAIQLKGLEDKLMAFEQAKGTQIAVLMVPTTLPEDDASYANRVGNAWKIGRKGVGDGVLVIVAKNDHKIRIEVAKALEGAIPDLAAKRIIDEAISPQFRQGNFAQGLQAGVDQLIARINGEALPEPRKPDVRKGERPGLGFDWTDLAIFLFVGVPVVGGVLRGMFGRKAGSFFTGLGAGAVALFITSSIVVAAIAALVALLFSALSGSVGGPRMGGWGAGPMIGGGGFGRGGGGWGGGGGGGGWGGSGGGGDFGGGGASGDW